MTNERRSWSVFGAVFGCLLVSACDLRDFFPIPGVKVHRPCDGDRVKNPVLFELEAKNWGIRPASEAGREEGYFVLSVDGDCLREGDLVPFEYPFVHLADGARRGWVELEPGVHVVCVFIATGDHRATRLSDRVMFTVVD